MRQQWILMLMLAMLGVAVVPTDARLAAGLVDHDKLRRCLRTALTSNESLERALGCSTACGVFRAWRHAARAMRV